jgi:hypothetical protein
MKNWYKSKTIWAGISGISTGLVMSFTGQIVAGVPLIIGGLQAIFLRDAIEKKGA